jgi:class 3 adenylate cyclase
MSAPTSIAEWLQKLGLGQYAQQFADNEITFSILPDLTDADLKELGVSALGHRRVLLRAIAGLENVEKGIPAHTTPAPASVTPQQFDSAERRQVTVMFSDLVGSTALSTRMDPEDLREVISSYQKCVVEIVQRFGGFVAKYMGDGVLIYFGYPQAHEDDAERAVRTGLELVAAVGGLTTHAPLQTRVGIATGVVVVGDLIGSGEAQERGIVGETPNLAARLQGVADPNAVVIAESTRKLLGNLFELQDLGTKDLKGISGLVRAWEAVRASSVESRFEALRTATTPLVGREEELELLMRRWAQAKGGDGCVVLISGEPGIGKSRIVQTVSERIGSETHTRLRYFCSPHHQESALFPVTAQLERAAGFAREDSAEERLAKLETVLAQGTNDLSQAVPLLADLLSIPPTDRYPTLDLTPHKRKEKTLAALITQIEGLSAREPLLMVFEDTHWSDATSREILDLLVDRIPTLRVLLVITFRPEFSAPWLGRPHVTTLTLSRLPPRQRAEMVGHLTGGKTLPKDITEQIVHRTDGVPLFIEELTKSIIDTGLVSEVGNHYAIAGTTAATAIPTSLHASLLARLDRLAPTREIAQIGAALGRSFSHELISAVAEIPQNKVDEALDQLVGAELIFRRGTPPNAEYTFKHALVQDAAYSTLLRSRRQQIHERVVSKLERQFPEVAAAQPQLLAYHCAEAALIEQAIEYRLRAGKQLIGRSAMVEAEAQIRGGLKLLLSLPASRERDEHELDLQMALSSILVATAGYAAPALAEVTARASQLSQDLDRPLERAFLLTNQGAYHLLGGELVLATKEATAILDLGASRNDAHLRFQGCYACAVVWFHLGDFSAAREYARSALQLYRPDNPLREWSSQDTQITSLVFMCRSLAYLGYLDQARHYREEALSKARAHAHTYAMALLITNEVDDAMRIEPTILLKQAEEAVALCREQGFPYWGAASLGARAGAFLRLGRAAEAVDVITDALAKFRATGGVTTVPWILTTTAEALCETGRPTEALKRLDEAEQQINATQERWREAEMYRAYGECLIACNDPASAENRFHRALAVARQQNAKLWEIRAATSLAQLWRDQGKRLEARNLLAPIYGWFTEGFDTPVLQDAKALVEELN